MAQNLVANGISNVVIDPTACSDVVGEVTFYISKNHHTSSLLKQRAGYENGLSESVPMPSVTLDRHWRGVAESGRRLVLVKIDIEGAGSAALTHCVNIAESQQCFFLIESHSCEEEAAIGMLARSQRFDAYRVSDARWVSQTAATYPNPNGIWGITRAARAHC
jgi:FkbM family methyltransferase